MMAVPRTAGVTHYGKSSTVNAMTINSLCATVMLCVTSMDGKRLGHTLCLL